MHMPYACFSFQVGNVAYILYAGHIESCKQCAIFGVGISSSGAITEGKRIWPYPYDAHYDDMTAYDVHGAL